MKISIRTITVAALVCAGLYLTAEAVSQSSQSCPVRRLPNGQVDQNPNWCRPQRRPQVPPAPPLQPAPVWTPPTPQPYYPPQQPAAVPPIPVQQAQNLIPICVAGQLWGVLQQFYAAGTACTVTDGIGNVYLGTVQYVNSN
jgi:hypothetical protein